MDAPPPPAAVQFTLKKPLKITKVVRPKVEEVVVVEVPIEEQVKQFSEKFGSTKCQISKLDKEASFGMSIHLLVQYFDRFFFFFFTKLMFLSLWRVIQSTFVQHLIMTRLFI